MSIKWYKVKGGEQVSDVGKENSLCEGLEIKLGMKILRIRFFIVGWGCGVDE